MSTINLIFSMDGPLLTDEQASAFAAFGEWRVLHEREGRLLVDAIGQDADIVNAMTALGVMGRAPEVIGGWQQDGMQLPAYPLDLPAWLEVAPEGMGGFIELHRWAGWAERQA